MPSSDILTHALAALTFFVGSWHCTGNFASNGKPIASTEWFSTDVGGTALLKHHADQAPWRYDAVELWSYDASGKSYRAFIQDSFGGTRTFFSPGWNGNTLIWSDTTAEVTQHFVYERLDAASYRVSYHAVKSGADRLVDTLVCKRG